MDPIWIRSLPTKTLPDGRIVCVMPLLYGRARITIGPDLDFYKEGW